MVPERARSLWNRSKSGRHGMNAARPAFLAGHAVQPINSGAVPHWPMIAFSAQFDRDHEADEAVNFICMWYSPVL
jgi:hypothetical protein